MSTEPTPSKGAPHHRTSWIGMLTDAVSTAFHRGPSGPGAPAVTINRNFEEVRAVFDQPVRLPAIVEQLQSVQLLSDGTSRWFFTGPTGALQEWGLETLHSTDRRIGWRATSGDHVVLGSIVFADAPAPGMTEVRVEIEREGSSIGIVGKLLAAPAIRHALRDLKAVMETGEVLHSDASIHAGPHPAQPSAPSPSEQGGAR